MPLGVRGRARWFATMVVAAVLIASVPVSVAATRRAAKPRRVPSAVVAVIDTGINPYHVTFRDDSARAYGHPSTYIPGYPRDAIALPITLTEPDYAAAVGADCETIWSHIEPGKLYWFPGTKIVGAVTFVEGGGINCQVAKPLGDGVILDPDGHGTMTASRAGSTEYGACRDCRIVSVQFPTTISVIDPGASTAPAVAAIEWAAQNSSWIDAQSNSWGPFLPLWEPTGTVGLVTANPDLVQAVEEVSRKHLAFWASGNGALFRLGAAGHPTPLSPHMTPSAVIVGGHDSGYVTTWPGFPAHVVSDSCDSWGAFRDKIDESAEDVGGGTSAATPFAAGGAVRILLTARTILSDTDTGVSNGVVARGRAGLVGSGPLVDGELTLAEWKRLLFVTASPRPKGQFEDGPPCGAEAAPYGPTPVKWTDVPEGYPEYLHIGYGAVDDDAIALALEILTGASGMPDRPDTDRYFEYDHMAREVLYGIFGG